LSVLTWQCLDRRIVKQQTVAAEARAWSQGRNGRQVDWRFTPGGARIKLKNLYPQVLA
jgi:hypothetical protein